MQTGQALRLEDHDHYRYLNRRPGVNQARPGRGRRRALRPTYLKAVDSARAPARTKARRAREWARPIVMAIIVAGEWLLLIADVFVRVSLGV